MTTRSVEAFLKRTAITYHSDSSKRGMFFLRCVIEVLFENASALRVYCG